MSKKRNSDMNEFEKMETTKNTLIDKEYIKVRKDAYDISKETTKEDRWFDYAGVPRYVKTSKKCYKIRIKMILIWVCKIFFKNCLKSKTLWYNKNQLAFRGGI